MEEEIPLYNHESKGHNGMIKKKVKKFRKSEFLTDLYITCMDGMVSMHKMLLLQKIPYFSQYLCEICDHHSATFLILPDVTKNELEKEVRNLYSYGIVSGLEVLFGFKKSYHHQKQSEPKNLEPQINEQRSLVAAVNDESDYNPLEHSSSDEESNVVDNMQNIVGNMSNLGGNNMQNMVDNMPDVSGNMPDVSGNMPNMVGNMKNMVDNMPNMVNNMPNMVGNMKNMVDNIPHMAGIMPNMVGNMQHMLGNMQHMVGNMPNMTGNMPLMPFEESDVYVKQEINPDEYLDQSESDIFGEGPDVKVDVMSMVKDELQDHSFEIIRSKKGNTSSPGILFVDNQYKFFCQTTENGKGDVMKYSYHCATRRYTKCPARAIVQRDESGQLAVIKCATNETHNHEASKVNLIVKRMQNDMIEMINVNQSLTAKECLTACQAKFSLEIEPQLWEEVLAHWAKPMKMRSLQTTLQRAKKSAMGLSGSLLSHMREVNKVHESAMMVGRAVVNVDQS